MRTIVAISGQLQDHMGRCVGTSRCGKDTVAQTLALYHDFEVVGLADDMSSIFYRLGGRDGGIFKEITDWRTAKRVLGTEARRDAHAMSVWRDVAKTVICYLMAHHPVPRERVAVPDVRYVEEVATLSALASRLDGRFVHLEVHRRAPADHVMSDHSSERPLPCQPDVTLNNFGSKRDLISQADRAGTLILAGDFDKPGLACLQGRPAVPADAATDAPY